MGDALSFSNGLMSGYQFVEGINNMRRQRTLDAEAKVQQGVVNDRAERQLSIRESTAANSQTTFDQGQADRAKGQEGQKLAADLTQRGGLSKATAQELERIKQLAPFSPALAQMITKQANVKQGAADLQALSNFESSQQSNQVPSNQAPRGGPAPAPGQSPGGPGQALSGNNFAGFSTDSLDATLPPRPTTNTRQIPASDVGISSKRPGQIGAPLLAGAPSFQEARGTTEVPGDFQSNSELSASGLPVAEQTEIKNRQIETARAGKLASALQQVETNKSTVEQVNREWQAFNDISNSSGDPLRDLTGTNPAAMVAKFARDYNSINETTRDQVAQKMREPIIKAQADAVVTMAAAKQKPDFNVGTDREYKVAVRQLKEARAIQRVTRKNYSIAVEAKIRGSKIPIGNKEVAQRIFAASKSTPPQSTPLTTNQARVATTQVERFVSRGGKRRTVPVSVYEAALRLNEDGRLSDESLQRLITTGTTTEPDKIKLQTTNPAHDVWKVNETDGSLTLMRRGDPNYLRGNSSTKKGKNAWSSDQKAIVKRLFGELNPLTDDAIIDELQFYKTWGDHPEYFAESNLPVENIKDFSEPEITRVAWRYFAMKDTESAYNKENDGIFGFGAKNFADKYDITNFDPVAKELGIDPQALPSPDVDLEQLREGLKQSTDSQERGYAKLPDNELRQLAIELSLQGQ